ncbi:MAG: hypothetical protein J7L04_13505, partial [Bacteroidales bacterium]|nr:hypothetical protein [Bacteroidales bacterium]
MLRSFLNIALIIVSFLFVFSACVTTQQLNLKEFSIQVLDSPDSLSFEKGTYVFVNRIPMKSKTTGNDFVKAGVLSLDVNYYNELSWMAINSCLDILDLSPVIDNVILDTVSRAEFAGDLKETNTPLDPDFVKNLIDLNNAIGVISLESLNLFDTLIIDPLYDTRTGDSVIWAFVAGEYVFPGINWRIYSNSGDVLLNYSSSDTLNWEGMGSTRRIAESQLFPEEQVLLTAMNHNGSDFGKKNFPYWISVQRVFYTTGSAEMKKAAKLAEKSDWLGAGEIWKTLVISEDKELAARACFNMALVSEINDNLNMA